MGWFQQKKGNARTEPVRLDPLDTVLVEFMPSYPWTVRDACEGTQIFGQNGSGKTSGSGQAIAKAFLRSGFGGLVLTAKTDERELWERWAGETGRMSDLVVFSPESGHSFNFLNYESRRPGGGGGLTFNLVNLFQEVMQVGNRKRGDGTDGFWIDAMNELLTNAIDLALLARGKITFDEIYQIIQSAPTSMAQTQDESWLESSFCADCLFSVHKRKAELAEEVTSDFGVIKDYWLCRYPELAPETRSAVVQTFTGMANPFLRHPFKRLFCQKTSLVPDLSMAGKIILLDFPVKEYANLGKFSQVLFKYIWQRAVERRDVAAHPVPVFLWADEAQFFVTSNDTKFQSTARSKRACTVYLTQSLPGYHAELGGGDVAKASVESLLTNLSTKIFHANGERSTNTFAADSIGQSLHDRSSWNVGEADKQKGPSAGGSEQMGYDIPPQAFTQLRCGGPHNSCQVDAVIFKSGSNWPRPYARVSFDQQEQ